MEPRYFESDGKTDITHKKGNYLYCGAETQNLAYEEIEFKENTSSGTILAKSVDAEIQYIIEVDLKYADKTRDKAK